MKHKLGLIFLVLFGVVACAEKAPVAKPEPPKAIAQELQSAVANEQVTVEAKLAQTQINLPETILFESGQARLTAEGKKTLKEIVTVLAKHEGYSLQVDGHTDSKPIGAKLARTYPDNLSLSKARAEQVAQYLKKEGKIRQRLVALGHGAEVPLGSNETAAGRKQNRRVSLTLIPLGEPPRP